MRAGADLECGRAPEFLLVCLGVSVREGICARLLRKIKTETLRTLLHLDGFKTVSEETNEKLWCSAIGFCIVRCHALIKFRAGALLVEKPIGNALPSSGRTDHSLQAVLRQ